MNITFHQICSSDFVKEPWLNLFFSNISLFMNESFDFRIIISAYFNFLSTLCTLARTTKQNDILQFLSEKCIGVQLTPIPLYDIVLRDAKYQMKGPKSSRLTRMLKLVQSVAHGNVLISSYLLNWHWPLYNSTDQTFILAHAKSMNESCSCSIFSGCIQPGVIYSSLRNNSHWIIPGLNIGCSIVDTVQHSTLQCLYNQTFVDLLQQFVQEISKHLPNTTNISVLDPLLKSRYSPYTTIVQMSYELFFEEGIIEISYAKFYEQCAPNYCSYTFEKHNNYPAIISRILALWGGLTLSLGLFAPCIVRLCFKINICCRKTRIDIVS